MNDLTADPLGKYLTITSILKRGADEPLEQLIAEDLRRNISGTS